MPRPNHDDPPVNVVISLPQSLATKLDLLLFDPVRGKPKYGARSKFIQQLIIDYLRKSKEHQKNANQS